MALAQCDARRWAYRTSDLEFAVFLWASGLKLLDLEPCPSNRPKAKQKSAGVQFDFLFVGKNNEDVNAQAAQLALSYSNEEALVEPTSLAQKRRLLKTLVEDAAKARKIKLGRYNTND